MKPSKYLVEHVSRFEYDEPVQGSLMLLRLRPRDDGRQRVLKFNLHVDPYAALTELEDPFGNRCHLFNVHRRHGATVVHSRVRVEAGDAPPLPGLPGSDTADSSPVSEHPVPDGWEALEAAIDPVDGWEFLQPSRYVRYSDALEAFTSANGIERGADPLSSLTELSARLHRAFQYDPGSTAVDSPMDHILETGRGVCQDYTHVMLAIARSWGIPGRYVSGYIHREGKEGEQSLPGASHSWGEFFIPDAGWVGIDPTNDTLADHRFVAVAVGRDYADACPTRGTVLGGGGSTLEVKVTVTADDETAPDWSPHREWPNLRAVSPTPHEYRGGFDQ
ncbi:MAG: transglutaminase family protein [Rhodospirillaceae bacterium]|nr:transglutaminase family protein [Rhodospirillaceae bacterium]MDE0000496.1 transglutaminase family protein [Rhodospirillaceae bacterium]MDE0362373.1 transglutaminase family protein [Rhodospirillaceae bacterium]